MLIGDTVNKRKLHEKCNVYVLKTQLVGGSSVKAIHRHG